MDAIRDILKGGVGRSLRALPHVDRLAAAWVVVCGRALSGHGQVTGYAEGVVEVEVDGGAWPEQFRSMRSELASELGRISGVAVTGIHFVVKR